MNKRIILNSLTTQQARTNQLYYDYRSDRGWRRVQRVCFWLLRRIGAVRWLMEQVCSHQEVTVDERKITEWLRKEIYQHKRMNINEIEMIIVGPEVLGCLEDEINRRNISFSDPALASLHLDFPQLRLFGIEVRFLSWFNGMLLVPKKDQT